MSWKDVVGTIGQVARAATVGLPDEAYMDSEPAGRPIPGTYYRDPTKPRMVMSMANGPDRPLPIRPGQVPPQQLPPVVDEPRQAAPAGDYDPSYGGQFAPDEVRPTPPPPAQPAQPDQPTNTYRTAMDAAFAKQREVAALDPRNKDELAAYYHGRKPDGKPIHPGMAENIGKGLLMAMQRIGPVMMDRNVSDKQALGYALGASLFGTINNAARKGLPYDEQRLAQDQQKATQDAAQAQGAYEADLGDRSKEANIKYLEERPDLEKQKIQQKVGDLKAKNFRYATERIKTMGGLIKDGVIDRNHNADFVDTLGDLLGVDNVTIDGFDKDKDKVVANSVTFAPDGRTMVTIIKGDGTTETKALKDPTTGKDAIGLENDRTKAAKILADAGITRTQIQTTSNEKIANLKEQGANLRQKLKLGAYASSMVQSEYDRLLQTEDWQSKSAKEIMAEAIRNVKMLNPSLDLTTDPETP